MAGNPQGLVRLAETNSLTLGSWQDVTIEDEAGTFMHELGHTLCLKHGGGDNLNCKPNYYSVMNYTWQFPNRNTWHIRNLELFNQSWRLDYSSSELLRLREAALFEAAGLGRTRRSLGSRGPARRNDRSS